MVQPEDFEWAVDDVTQIEDVNGDGIPVVLLNKKIPNAEVQLSGMKYKENWPRQYLNYMFNLTFRWIKYLNDRAGKVSGKNYLINGDFNIWQRATSFTGSGYTADRWSAPGAAGSVVSKVADSPSGFGSCAEVTHTVGSNWLQTRLEGANCAPLALQVCTISYWTYNISGATQVTIIVESADALDNFSTNTTVSSAVKTSVLNTWTKHTHTFTATAAVANGIQIRIVSGSAAAVNRIADVKLEEGEYATNFEQRSVGEELALCQRYYYKNDTAALMQKFIAGSNINTGYFPITMRTLPSVIIKSGDTGTAGQIYDLSAAVDRAAGVNRVTENTYAPFFSPIAPSFGATCTYYIEADAEI
jgi:hypothetical protein